MSLNFPGSWRFSPPPDGDFRNSSIPDEAIQEFENSIDRMPANSGRWSLLEHFKSHFGSQGSSSSESWAYSDLSRLMNYASTNAPLFIEKFYDACTALDASDDEWCKSAAAFINNILIKHNIGYELRPPMLVAREVAGPSIAVVQASPSFTDGAREILSKSLRRSEILLLEGNPREAVQELLWLLETVSTAFRGIETQSGKIEGKYFNQIVRDLRNKHTGTTLDRVLEWISSMHGYLSSPTGGGVRHGVDLNRGVDLDINEARLFCNLTRSYISFLLVEHDSLQKID